MRAAKRAKTRGIDRVHLSLSHDGPHAVALAVAEGAEPARKRTGKKTKK